MAETYGHRFIYKQEKGRRTNQEGNMFLNRLFIAKQNRVLLLMLIVVALFIGCGENKQNNKTYRIGILCGVGFFADTADSFKDKMSFLGYKEGENIVYDLQKIYHDPARQKRALQKFVSDNVDLIFSFPTEASLEAKAAVQGTKIAVVFANANIEGVGLVDSVRSPGGNITGVRFPGPQLAIKRFEIMREIAPQTEKMWIPYQQGYPIVDSQLKALRPMAGSLGIALEEVPATDATNLQANLDARAALNDIGKDAVLIIADPLPVNPDGFRVLAQFAAKHKIPVGGALMPVGDHGSVFGVSTKNSAVGKQAAIIADKILKGVPAGTIPVVSAESFLSIHYKSAQQLGLHVSEGLLSKADEIIR